MNITEAFIDYLEYLSVGTFGTDLFIGGIQQDAPDDCWWVILDGGTLTSQNMTGETFKEYSLRIFYRSKDAEQVYNQIHSLEVSLSSTQCLQLETFGNVETTLVGFPKDEDIDVEGRTTASLLLRIRTYYDGDVTAGFVPPDVTGNGVWGEITGTVTDQTDLITYLSDTYLKQANNLSDVDNVQTARNNILPSQTGQANKYLKTDGTNATWETVSGGGGGTWGSITGTVTDQTDLITYLADTYLALDGLNDPVTGTVIFRAHVGFGNVVTIDDSYIFPAFTYSLVTTIQEEVTDLSAQVASGFRVEYVLNPSVAPISSTTAGDYRIRTKSGNNQNFGTVISLNVSTEHLGGGDILDFEGLSLGLYNSGPGTITDMYPFYLASPTAGGGVTTNHGLEIQNQTVAGITNSWNIRSFGTTSKNYFQGAVLIGTQNTSLSSGSNMEIFNNTGAVLTLGRSDTTANANDVIAVIRFYNNDATLTTQNLFGNIEMQAAQAISTNAAAGRLIVRVTGTTVGGSPIEQFNIIDGLITFKDVFNFAFNTTTGSKFGTATTQKIGFWNATPIVQPTTSVAAATRVGGGGTTLTDTDTFDGYTVAKVVKALRNTGLLA